MRYQNYKSDIGEVVGALYFTMSPPVGTNEPKYGVAGLQIDLSKAALRSGLLLRLIALILLRVVYTRHKRS